MGGWVEDGDVWERLVGKPCVSDRHLLTLAEETPLLYCTSQSCLHKLNSLEVQLP